MSGWKHQRHEFMIGKEKRGRALLWPMRSGKTKGAIDKACYNLDTGFIEGVIILAPNGVHVNWVKNEIPKWAWADMDHRAFAWSTPKRINFEQQAEMNAMFAHDGPKWFAVNKEALNHPDCQAAIRRFKEACHRKFMLIVDESHHFGKASAKRTRLARGLAKIARLRLILSGTPILNGPRKAFTQYEIVKPGALGFENSTDFENHFCEIELRSIPGIRKQRRVITGYKNLDELRDKIAKWSSVVLRSDIHDMPTLLSYDRPVIMSDKQRKAYLEMVSRHLLEIGDGSIISAREGGARMMKLQQIVNGYIVDSKTNQITTIDDEAPIYDALANEVDGTLPGKSLIWCRLREDVRRVCKRLHHDGHQPIEFHGGITSADEREARRVEFNTSQKPRPLVGTLGTGGEGLDFSAAEAVIFFSVAPNAEAVAQGQERATVKGGKSISLVRLRTYGTVDDRLWQIVDNNTTLADSISGKGLRDWLLQTDV